MVLCILIFMFLEKRREYKEILICSQAPNIKFNRNVSQTLEDGQTAGQRRLPRTRVYPKVSGLRR
jgi:hypothetical protein